MIDLEYPSFRELSQDLHLPTSSPKPWYIAIVIVGICTLAMYNTMDDRSGMNYLLGIVIILAGLGSLFLLSRKLYHVLSQRKKAEKIAAQFKQEVDIDSYAPDFHQNLKECNANLRFFTGDQREVMRKDLAFIEGLARVYAKELTESALAAFHDKSVSGFSNVYIGTSPENYNALNTAIRNFCKMANQFRFDEEERAFFHPF